MNDSKFELGDKVVVVQMEMDEGDTSLIGMTGEVVSKQASNEDKPGGPDGPWMITVHLDGMDSEDGDAWFNEDELAKVTGYKITGTVPTPMSNPRLPYYDHHPSTEPGGKSEAVGEAGRTVSVTTTSEGVAETLVSVYRKVFQNVEREALHT